MESNRQKKIAGVIQKDIVDILQKAARNGGMKNVLISVSKVNITVDLAHAKVYLSIFPQDKRDELLVGIKSNSVLIKHDLAQRTRHQLRRVPSLEFFVDDTLDYVEDLNQALKGEENPIENRDLLDKRPKV